LGSADIFKGVCAVLTDARQKKETKRRKKGCTEGADYINGRRARRAKGGGGMELQQETCCQAKAAMVIFWN
jgi:hypothetical protein